MLHYTSPIFINLTKKCNFFCSYCYNSSSRDNKLNCFVTDNWDSIINQINCTSTKEIRLSGGEPLLVDNIANICKSIHSNNISYTLTTNGFLLKKNLGWMEITQPSSLWISYHEEYNTYKSFKKLLSIINLHQTKIGVNIFLEDLVNNSQLFGLFSIQTIKRFKILYKTPIGRATILKQNYSLSESIPLIKNALGKHNPEIRIESPLIKSTEKGVSSCVLKKRPLITIDSDGEIYECCIAINDKSSSLGNLSEKSFLNILEKYSANLKKLPCKLILPNITNGIEPCPLNLINIKTILC